MAEQTPVPVTLLSGFLGAGKTTLLNRILTERHGERIAVVVNEFGDVPIDGRLVVGSDEEVVELSNGCVCCTVRGDLVRTVGDLLARRKRRLFRSQPFERLLIEGSGLASPGPIVQTLEIEPELAEATSFDGVVTLTHAAQILEQLEQHPEASEQVGYADVLLLNHTDRVPADELEAVRSALADLNPSAELVVTRNAEVEIGRLFGRPRDASHEPSVQSSHGHTRGAGTLVLRSEVPLDLHRLKMWIQFVSSKRTHELWRIKGIVRCSGRPEPVVVQGVYQWLELGPGQGVPPAESVVVLIGRELEREELERGWRLCQAPDSGS